MKRFLTAFVLTCVLLAAPFFALPAILYIHSVAGVG